MKCNIVLFQIFIMFLFFSNSYAGFKFELTNAIKDSQQKLEEQRRIPPSTGEWKIYDENLVCVGTGGENSLMWPRDRNSAGCNYNGELNWNDAMSWSTNLVCEGYNDWRLPTRDELEELYNYGRSYINYGFDTYWSSDDDSDTHAGALDFFDGDRYSLFKTGSEYVRAVRSHPGSGAPDTDPDVSITNPADASTVSGTVSVTASASDDNGISKVEFYIDDTLKVTDTSSPYSYSWDTTAESDGSHTVKVIAYDTANQTATDQHTVTVTVFVANQSPTISSLTANPPSVSPSGNSTITCSASDPDGDTLTYSWSKTGGTISGSGSQVTWTAPATEGTYTITCTADDGNGETDQKTVNVSVSAPGSHELPDTGQSQSYTATLGEDHDYQPAASQPSYTDNGNGTITDNRTGLMWLKNVNEYNSGNAQSWENALSGCESFSYAGYSDWRLPNVRELESIVNLGEESPCINTTYFPNTQSSDYWTSTTYAWVTDSAWQIEFDSGYVNSWDKTNAYYVRPVRGGP